MKQPPLIIVQLVHILGPLKGEIQEFTTAVITIGRHPESHLRFPADLTTISRKHAEIRREGNQFKLIDHSANGTFVNGKRIKEIYLKNGDVLTFAEEGGPKVSFLTQIKESSAEAEKIPPPTHLRPEPPSAERPQLVTPEIKKPAEVAVQSVKAPLIIQYGATLHSFRGLPVTIGKHSKCEYRLDHPAILNQHAQIFFAQNQYWVKDLTGQGLVEINRQPVALQAPLKLHDQLALSPQGPNFRFLGEGRFIEVAEPSVEDPLIEPNKKKSWGP